MTDSRNELDEEKDSLGNLPKKKGRKNKYVPGLAALNFKPTYDWKIEEAKNLFKNIKHSIPANEISYSDCISGMKILPDESIDLIIADPPFGINFNGRENFYNRKKEYVAKGYSEINEDYGNFTDLWISKIPRIMKQTSSAYIFSGWTNLFEVLSAIKKTKLTLINHIIWKYQFGVFTKHKFVSSHYHVLFLVKNPKDYFFNKIDHYPEDVWNIPRIYRPGQKKNGTKLPENVVSRCINFSSKPGDIILDPFMGNGTTAVCAKANFRNYVGFEINREMKDIIEKNVNNIMIGEEYKPYISLIPSIEELAKKYPAIKKMIRKKKNYSEKN